MNRVDAHVHLWRIGHNDCAWPGRDLPAIHRDYAPADLERELSGNGVGQALLVQSQPSERDTVWLLGLAAHPSVAGVIGWADLARADIDAHLEALRASGPLVGLRAMVQNEAEDWLDQPDFDPGFSAMARYGLVFDALIRPRHLPALRRLAARHPGLSIVIDHGAKPDIGHGLFDPWLREMRVIAENSHVSCKLSGLLTELGDGQPVDAVARYVHSLIDLFGPDRLIWGSDWPVLTLHAGYGDWLALARGLVPEDIRPAVFGANATRIYGLPR